MESGYVALMLTQWQRLVYVEQRNVPLVIGLVAVYVELWSEASIYDVCLLIPGMVSGLDEFMLWC